MSNKYCSVSPLFLVSLLFCLAIVASGHLLNGLIPAEEEPCKFYELKKGNFSLKVTNFGARIVSAILPDKHGNLEDITLGYDRVEDYFSDPACFGCTVGRFANRIGGAQFILNGITFKLFANAGKNFIHGLFGYVKWKVTKYENNSQSPSITFTYLSPDGEMGFPGDLDVAVTYALVGENQLAVTMEAKALNKPTPVNLAQHAYWNLGGQSSGDILSHEVQIFGSRITLVDKELIPTGEIGAVKGTPYDFLQPHAIGSQFSGLSGGYDINYALDGRAGRNLKPAAVLKHESSGRVMEVFTNAPGLQFYTADGLKDLTGKSGYVYKANAGVCLETQGFPDSVNHPNFPSQILYPGDKYRHHMLYKFSTKI